MNARPVKPTQERIAYSINEACEATGLSRTFVLTLLERGELRHRKLGKRIVIPRSALLELVGEA